MNYLVHDQWWICENFAGGPSPSFPSLRFSIPSLPSPSLPALPQGRSCGGGSGCLEHPLYLTGPEGPFNYGSITKLQDVTYATDENRDVKHMKRYFYLFFIKRTFNMFHLSDERFYICTNEKGD